MITGGDSYFINHHEEEITDGSGYMDDGYQLIIPNTIGWHSIAISYPIDSNIFSGSFTDRADMDGCIVEMIVAGKNVLTGALIADANIGDTEIFVSPTVLQYAKKGYFFEITDGVNSNVLGRVLSVDINTNKVTIETPLDNNFLAASPTYVLQTIYYVKNRHLSGTNRDIEISGSTHSSFLTANTPIYIYIYNFENVSKKLNFALEVFQ